MTVKEYASDVNLSVAEILKKCNDLGIEVKSGEDELTDLDVITLDNAINLIGVEDDSYEEEETIDEVVDEIVESTNITKNINITDKKQKLKKKKDQVESKDYSRLRKEMYKNKDKFMNIMSTIMIGFTYVLLSLAFLRMRFYEITYGYTMLRLFVYIILFTEGIMLIPTIIYIWKRDLKLINIYFIIGVVVYTLINFINFDCIIAKENINRYSKTGELDIHYLVHSLEVDASEEILKLQSDEQFSEEIYQYKEKLRNISDSYDNSWMSYNIGREKIKKIFK